MTVDKRFQVFVSSTYADLKEERRAVIQALMELDCIPAGMEIFPAADEEQFSFIKRVIDDCDYYVLIIGGRYGSTTAEGISYTEKEYDYARDRQIPVLAFVHQNPGKIPLEKSDIDATLRAKLEAFKAKVMTGKLVKMWDDPKELPGMVALSLSKTIKTHPAIGWVRADRVASTEVLADINELRKRNEALEKTIDELTPAVAEIAGLDDPFEITGRHRIYGSSNYYKWSIKPTWGEIFATLGPHIIEQPNDLVMNGYYTSMVRELCKSKDIATQYGWETDDQGYQQVKVQFMALKLADIGMAGTVNGGQALFWALTELGEQTLLQLRTAKKPQR